MTAQTIQHDDWILRADAAAIARCSEDSIRRDISNHELKTRRDDRKRVLVKVADLIRVGRIRAEDLTTGMTAPSPPRLSAPSRPSAPCANRSRRAPAGSPTPTPWSEP